MQEIENKSGISTASIGHLNDASSEPTIEKMSASLTLKSRIVNGNLQIDKLLINPDQKLSPINRNSIYQANQKIKKRNKGIKQVNVDIPEINSDQLRALATILRLLLAEGITVSLFQHITLLNTALNEVNPAVAMSKDELKKIKIGNKFIETPIANVLQDIQIVTCKIGREVIRKTDLWGLNTPTMTHINKIACTNSFKCSNQPIQTIKPLKNILLILQIFTKYSRFFKP